MRTRTLVLVLSLAVSAGGLAWAARINVRVEYDKTFDFAGKHTYAWHPTGVGNVMVLQNFDKPEEIRAALEPAIVQAVDAALARRGFLRAAAGAPDFHVFYYLLIGQKTSAQYLGQFLPAVREWDVPTFPGSTTSLRIVEQGTLVLDLASVQGEATVWRAIAEAEILRANTQAQRVKRINDAVVEMLKKYPPRR